MKKIYKLIATALCLATIASSAPAFAAQSTSTFTDVSPTSWYYEVVTTLAENGFVSGYPDGTFRPDAPVTFREFASMVSHLDAYDPHNVSISDPVLTSSNDDITRQIAIKMLLLGLGITQPTKAIFLNNPFTDISYDALTPIDPDTTEDCYAYEDYILNAYHLGIISGSGDGYANPTAKLTRAEACQLLANAQAIKTSTPPAPQRYCTKNAPLLKDISPEEGQRALASLSYCLLSLPSSVREKLEECGITFCVMGKDSPWGDTYGGYYYAGKRIEIYTQNAGTATTVPFHEIGHFVWDKLVSQTDKAKLGSLFNSTEPQKASTFMGDYFKQNVKEYFAELYSYLYSYCGGTIPSAIDPIEAQTYFTPAYYQQFAQTNFPESAALVLKYMQDT